MASPAAPQASAQLWTQRLYGTIPLAPGWVGALLAAILYALFLCVEAAVGRARLIIRGDPAASGEALITLLLVVMLAYLCTVTVSAASEAPHVVRRMRHLLAGTDRELDALEAAAATRPRGWLTFSGLVWTALALGVPFLEVGQAGWSPYDWRSWTPESTWHRLLTPCLGWWGGRLMAVMLIDSLRHSALAQRIATIDLLDLRPLVPLSRLGLSNALRVVGIAAIFSFMLIDVERYGLMVLAFVVVTVTSASTALVLPVIGVHRRIGAAKREELDRVNRAIRGEPDALGGSGLAGREPAPSLADLVAYRGLVEGAREWPFDASIFLRFALYLTIPIGSWLGGALVERAIDAVLD